jgi:hypothetical protein
MRHNRRRQTPLGTTLPAVADGRTRNARRLRDLTIKFEEEIGADQLTPLVRARIAAAVAVLLTQEKLNGDLACGQPVDPDQVLAVATKLESILRDLKPARPNASAP